MVKISITSLWSVSYIVVLIWSREEPTPTSHDRYSLMLPFRAALILDLVDWMFADAAAVRSHSEGDKIRHRASERSLGSKGARDSQRM